MLCSIITGYLIQVSYFGIVQLAGFTLIILVAVSTIVGDSLDYKTTVTITYEHYKTNNIKLKLLKLNKIGNNNILIQDKIYYESGNIFYEGTLYGNTFNLGKFYNDDGTLLYHKKL